VSRPLPCRAARDISARGCRRYGGRVFWDVHSHVVPSGDDGASTLEEGAELCRSAAAHGTTVLFATPHVWPHLPLTPQREEAIRAAHTELGGRAGREGLDLRLGFELTPAPALLEDDLTRYRLGDLDAVLMELPFAGPLGLAERVAEEIESAGLMPVLGHPERAEAVILDRRHASAYAERGWLLQVNASSLLGYHGDDPEETGWALVEDGLVALVASDGHRTARPPHLDEAYEAAKARVGEAVTPLFDGTALKALSPVA
jgi:protein-tyrosine phosphatase